ncbi:CapA family protein [Candidatus Chlorohelix sp.]|uniref:CapA family protein n=1 Tax=Candidatus Chlorohelix sp. TaxID=3139201 RepID=UPI0030316D38
MRNDILKKAGIGFASLLLYLLAGIALWFSAYHPKAHAEPLLPQPDAQVTLLAVGDVMLGRDVALSSAISPEKSDYPFAVMPKLRKGVDLVFGNLESPIVAPENRSNASSGGYLFPADSESAGALKRNGFDIVTLANNHSLDYGRAGLQDTINSLKSAGVAYVGAGEDAATANQTVYMERNGLRLAFIAATSVYPTGLDGLQASNSPVALLEPQKILGAIKEARTQADVVIVALHWGDEYNSSASTTQRDFAAQASEAGADLIIGAHSHVVGDFEVITHTFVAYSLGNFVFDSRFPPETRQSAGLYIKLDKRGVSAVSAVPLKIEANRPDYYKPSELEPTFTAFSAHSLNLPLTEVAFWNGSEWRTAPALAYMRDSTADKASLPVSRTVQVRDIVADKGGYTTGRAVEDFSKELQTDERLELKNGTLRVWRFGLNISGWKLIWESKAGWQVEHFDFGDADEDGRPELMFSMWKNDGWDDVGQYRSHPFVYGWRRDAFRPVWAGSALADPIREFALADLADDGGNELVALEGNYSDERTTPARYLTIWRWMGWGYELLYRSEVGNFTALSTLLGQPYVYYRHN